jgi:hypothetical protein
VYTDDSEFKVSENTNLSDKGITVGLGTYSCNMYFQKDYTKPQPKKEVCSTCIVRLLNIFVCQSGICLLVYLFHLISLFYLFTYLFIFV